MILGEEIRIPQHWGSFDKGISALAITTNLLNTLYLIQLFYPVKIGPIKAPMQRLKYRKCKFPIKILRSHFYTPRLKNSNREPTQQETIFLAHIGSSCCKKESQLANKTVLSLPCTTLSPHLTCLSSLVKIIRIFKVPYWLYDENFWCSCSVKGITYNRR